VGVNRWVSLGVFVSLCGWLDGLGLKNKNISDPIDAENKTAQL